MKIVYIGGLKVLPESPDHEGIIQGFQMLDIDYAIVDPNVDKPMLIAILREKPDIVIHGITDSLFENLAADIKKELPKVKQFFWMMDYRPDNLAYEGGWKLWEKSKGCFDHIFLSNKAQLKMWSEYFKCPTSYLPHGCVVKKIVKDKKKYPDVVFIGGKGDGEIWGKRTKLIQSIADRLAKCGVEFSWINQPGGDSTPERRDIWKQMPAIYHNSKIVLDISHFWDVEGYASGRFFYSSGLGGCTVTRWFPGADRLYPEGIKNYFHNEIEAVDIILRLLKNENEIELMKERAWEWNRKNHNYKLRFEEIFKYV